MSASTHQETRPRRNASSDASPPAAAPEAAPSNVVTLEIAGLEVTLPVKFNPGHVLTETQARVLDAAYQRQFTNNQNAIAKARAEAFTKATTDAERAAKAPLTAPQIAALYADYEPNVGGAPRQSAMEKIRADAAWRMWTAMVTQHNDSVASGGPAIIAKAGAKPVALGFKAKKLDDGSVLSAQAQKDSFVSRILAIDAYAPKVQEHVDMILAERGTKKDAAPAEAVVSGEDLI